MLAKNQNSYKTQEEFVPAQFESHQTVEPAPCLEVREEFTVKQEFKPDLFALPNDFWSTLNSDKGVAKEIERIINQEVEKRYAHLESKNAEVLKQRLVELESEQRVVSETKQKEGFEAGHHAGTQQAEKDFESFKQQWISDCETLKADMNRWIQAFIEEKHQLLTSHQNQWLRAMSELMRKFLVSRSGQVENGIRHWLETEVSHFKTEEKLKLYVPLSQHERLVKIGVSAFGESLELAPDSTLQNNQFKIEAKSGGLFFSPDEQMAKLEQIITDCFDSKE